MGNEEGLEGGRPPERNWGVGEDSPDREKLTINQALPGHGCYRQMDIWINIKVINQIPPIKYNERYHIIKSKTHSRKHINEAGT